MKTSPLEQALLEWFEAHHPDLGGVAGLEVARREYTGAGFYAYLRSEDSGELDHPPISGPLIESSQLAAGGGCLLWLSARNPVCIEVYAYGDSFPEDLAEFKLVDPDTTPKTPAQTDRPSADR